MKVSAILNPTLYAFFCLIWVVFTLTLFGPMIGSKFYPGDVAPKADILTELTRPTNLTAIGIVLGLGAALAWLGTALWFDAGKIARAVIALFLAVSTEMLAYALGFVYEHWLPAVMLNMVVAAVVIPFVLRRRQRQPLA